MLSPHPLGGDLGVIPRELTVKPFLAIVLPEGVVVAWMVMGDCVVDGHG